MNLNTATLTHLLRQTEKAARVAVRNRFLMETYLSAMEAKAGKTTRYRSARTLFKKLGI